MAIVGGIFYGLLTQTITFVLGFSSELALVAAFIVFFFYLASRCLLLFSGIQTPYYSKGGRTSSVDLYENTHFHQTAQWVGKFYHYHDMVLFAFLALLSIVFLISLLFDGIGNKPLGQTIQSLLKVFTLP
jgi:hypothetical protein